MSQVSKTVAASVADPILQILGERRSANASRRNGGVRRTLRPILRSCRQLRARGRERALYCTKLQRVVVSLPDRAGTFELPPGSRMTRRVLEGGYESLLMQLVRTAIVPGYDAIDVGANVGLYTVPIAKLTHPGGRVLAVEPVPANLELLTRNIERNKLSNVVAFRGALGSGAGQYEVYAIEGREEYSSLRSIAHLNARGGKETVFKSEVDALDQLVVEHRLEPAFVKIDVEGAEYEVLCGAMQVLKDNRPAILSEMDDRLLEGFGRTSRDVMQLLQQNEYLIWNAESGEALQGEFAAPFVGNIVALPREIS